MEAVGLAASVLAISKFAVQVIHTVKMVLKTFRHLAHELESVLSELQTLHRVLRAIGDLLPKDDEESNKRTKVIRSEHLSSALCDCRVSLRELYTVVNDIQNTASRSALHNFWRAANWSETKVELARLGGRLQSNKITLGLSMQLSSL